MLVGELSGLNHAGRLAFISGLVMEILALCAVLLRFSTKFKTRLPFSPDDYLLLGGLVTFQAWFGVQVWGLVQGGGGRNIQDPTFDFTRLRTFLQALYAVEPLYGLSVTLIKLSILVFLHRIFYNNGKSFIIYSLYTICVLWWIVYTITTCVNCRPVHKFWNPKVEGYCYNYGKFWLGVEIVDILINFSILITPLNVLWRLKLPMNKKISASALFVFGGFVCITGVIRLALTYIPGSAFVSFSQAYLWTNIHIGVAIICACLPLLAPILGGIGHVLRGSVTGVSQLLQSMRRGSNFSRDQSKNDDDSDADVERGGSNRDPYMGGEDVASWSATAKGAFGEREEVLQLQTFPERAENRADSACIRVETTISVK